MKTLFCLTLLGGGFTLILAGLKGPLLRRCGGRWYRCIWLLALAAYTIPYKIALPEILQGSGMSLPAGGGGTVGGFPEATGIDFPAVVPFPAETLSISEILCTVYFIGLAAFILYTICIYVCFRRRLEQASEIVENENTKACFAAVCQTMGIRRCIRLCENGLAVSPMLVGLFRPQVILPKQEFSTEELHMIFRHELTHYKRNDLLYKAAALAVRAVHWFNPLSALMLRNISEACEYSCDEAVVNGLDINEKRKYGEILLSQIRPEWKNAPFSAGFFGKGKQKKVLERRIEVIMRKKQYQWVGATVLLAAGLVAGTNFMNFKPVYAVPDTVPAQAELPQKLVRNAPSVPSIQNEEDAVRVTSAAVSRLFNTETADMEIWAELDHGENSVQPEGWWFIEFSRETLEYAVWLNPDTGSLRIVHGMTAEILSTEEKTEIRQDTGWLEKAETLLKENYGESRKPVEISFVNLEKTDQRTADIRLLMEDGTYYTISFRSSDGALKSFQYTAENIV